MEKQKIHIAVCLDKDYVMPTGVMMYSACVNNPDVDIDFHIIIDESVTMAEQQDLIDSICMFEGKRVLFYNFKNRSEINFPIIFDTHLPRAAYYRLFLSSILPAFIDKVLYLDGDLIVRHSLLPLWHTDLTGYAVGATIDVSEGNIGLYNRLKYPSEKGYFNSGVLLINLKYWRDNQVEKECLEYIINYPDRIFLADQDVMNVILQDKKLIISIKFNLQTSFLRKVPGWDYLKYEEDFKESINDPVVVHFTSKWKPWFADLRFPHPYRNTFLKYQCQTKWKNCCYDRRSLYMKFRNSIGDVLRKVGIKKQIDSIFIDILPID